MKTVLVTGVNSYIGNAFIEYMKQFPADYSVEGISVRNNAWKTIDFSKYDCIFDVAGIAHADTGHVTEDIKQRYYKVNTDLTIALAKKAKESGVKQFIFVSSAIVYGNSAPIGQTKIITKDTVPAPADFYGDSKWQAEKGIIPLGDERFRIVILRPPMIYGKNSKGNYPTLSKLAQKLPVFPRIENCRSMLYIGNLVEFVRLMIQNDELMLIDMGEVGYGHPVLDLAHAYSSMVTLVGDYEKIIGIPRELGVELWKRAIDYYFEGLPADVVALRKEQIKALSCIRNFSWLALSDSFPEVVINECRALFDKRVTNNCGQLLEVCQTLKDWQ